jgi:hypothetical protein
MKSASRQPDWQLGMIDLAGAWEVAIEAVQTAIGNEEQSSSSPATQSVQPPSEEHLRGAA